MKKTAIALITMLLWGTGISTAQELKPIEQGKQVISYANGKDSMVCSYQNWRLHGLCTEYYPEGTKHLEKSYQDGAPLNLIQYYPDGNIKRREIYVPDGFLTISEGHLYDTDGKELDFIPYMELPAFPGGKERLMKVLNQKVKYPINAAMEGIQGTILFKCSFDEDGSPLGVSLIEGVSPELNKEAKRVVDYLMKKFKFAPGKTEGKPQKMSLNIPISFRLR